LLHLCSLTALARDSWIHMNAAVIIGLFTGLVSAGLFGSAASGTALGLFVLFFLAPMPVAIAGFGWGWLSALISALVGTLAIAVVIAPRPAVLYLLTAAAPMVLLSYLLLLNRAAGPAAASVTQPAPQPTLEWYPLGWAIGWMALWAGGLGALAILSVATDTTTLASELQGQLERLLKAGMKLPPIGGADISDTQRLGLMASLMAALMPAMVAIFWMLSTLLNAWLAGLVVNASGNAKRPWPDIRLIQLPRAVPIAFVGSILATFLDGMAGLVATGFASAIFLAYVFVGLAIIHQTTLGLSARPAILAGVYTALFLFNPFSSLIIGMIGVAEPISLLNRFKAAAPRPPST